MRSSLFCLIFAALLALVAGWTKEDHEIFRLRDELELSEGDGLNFYQYVGVSPSASQKEIEKAYRKKSVQLHPDKAERNFIASRYAQQGKGSGKPRVNTKPSQREIKKAVRDAQEKYQRLTVIKTILTSESKVRYDHFLKNGFPQWRSTGYYYERYRPGLVSVLIGLWVFSAGGVHYGVMLLNHRQNKNLVDRIIKKARKDAFGSESSIAAIPGIDATGEVATASSAAPPAEKDESMPEPRNRKERRMMEKMQAKEKSGKDKAGKDKNGKASSKRKAASKSAPTDSDAPAVPKRRVTSLNGKPLLVANDGQVYLEEEDDEGNVDELLLDPETMEAPTFGQTALVRAPVWLANYVQAKISGKTGEDSE